MLMRGVAELLFFMKAPETERDLKSGLAVRHRISASWLEIKTGDELWSMRASTGVGAQVAGASIQHIQRRCWGRTKGEGMYSSTSLASTNSSESPLFLLSSKTASASNIAATVVDVVCDTAWILL